MKWLKVLSQRYFNVYIMLGLYGGTILCNVTMAVGKQECTVNTTLGITIQYIIHNTHSFDALGTIYNIFAQIKHLRKEKVILLLYSEREMNVSLVIKAYNFHN